MHYFNESSYTCMITLIINIIQFLEWPTPGGERLLVQLLLELSWSTLEELGELIIVFEEDWLKCFVYLHDDPDYIPETAGVAAPFQSIYIIYGAEYEFFVGPLVNATEHNAPCAICFVPTRASVIMIPAKTVCPSSWTREYYGYLTTELDSDTHHRSSFTCLDNSPEGVSGTETSTTNTAFLYYTITTCNGLSCPPYENNRILSCVVCTKWWLYSEHVWTAAL